MWISTTLDSFSTVLPLLLIISTLLAAVLLRPLRGTIDNVRTVDIPSVTRSSASSTYSRASGTSSPTKGNPSIAGGPSPKWWIVTMMNVVLSGAFGFSVFLFFSESPNSHYAPVVWSLCIGEKGASRSDLPTVR